MEPSFISHTDLLIVGAGPAGLTAACWACEYPMSTRIIDDKSDRTATGHADGIQSRTLEILDSFGIADSVLRQATRDTEMCYWVYNEKDSCIRRVKRIRAENSKLSRFNQVLLNQGSLEQLMLDHLSEKGQVIVERNMRAEILQINSNESDEENDDFPITVHVTRLDQDPRTNNSDIKHTQGCNSRGQSTEVIKTRYLIGCDGAHSWTRSQLNVPLEQESTDSIWAVMDIIPVTDFPDIRQSCAIRSNYGSMMITPRENRLVRLYIQLMNSPVSTLDCNSSSNEPPPRFLLETAQVIIKPYYLTFRRCDWWSIYKISQQLTSEYRPHERVFLSGDAAHNHSPKAGQGMNVSMQDTFNLGWKIGAVITGGADRAILDTYATERSPVGKELIELDKRFVQAYEQSLNKSLHDHQTEEVNIQGLKQVREQSYGFMTGVKVKYRPGLIVSEGLTVRDGEKSLCSGPLHYPRNIELGVRLSSFPLVSEVDGLPVELSDRLLSDGKWRLVVFSGDLGKTSMLERLNRTGTDLGRYTLPTNGYHRTLAEGEGRSSIEVLLIHSGPRLIVSLLDLPEIFHPYDETLGWEYWKVFADDDSYGCDLGKAYDGYGIDREVGCLVLIRPDQHVGWIGALDDLPGLEFYLSQFLSHWNLC